MVVEPSIPISVLSSHRLPYWATIVQTAEAHAGTLRHFKAPRRKHQDDLAPVSRPHRDGTTREGSWQPWTAAGNGWVGQGIQAWKARPTRRLPAERCLLPCDCSGTVQLHHSGWTLVSGPLLRSAFKVDV